MRGSSIGNILAHRMIFAAETADNESPCEPMSVLRKTFTYGWSFGMEGTSVKFMRRMTAYG